MHPFQAKVPGKSPAFNTRLPWAKPLARFKLTMISLSTVKIGGVLGGERLVFRLIVGVAGGSDCYVRGD